MPQLELLTLNISKPRNRLSVYGGDFCFIRREHFNKYMGAEVAADNQPRGIIFVNIRVFSGSAPAQGLPLFLIQ